MRLRMRPILQPWQLMMRPDPAGHCEARISAAVMASCLTAFAGHGTTTRHGGAVPRGIIFARSSFVVIVLSMMAPVSIPWPHGARDRWQRVFSWLSGDLLRRAGSAPGGVQRTQRATHARRKDRVDQGGVAGTASGELVSQHEDRRQHRSVLVIDPHAEPVEGVAAVQRDESRRRGVEPPAVGTPAAARSGQAVKRRVDVALDSSWDRRATVGLSRSSRARVARPTAARCNPGDGRDRRRMAHRQAGQLRLRGRHVRPPSIDQSTAPSGRATYSAPSRSAANAAGWPSAVPARFHVRPPSALV